MRDEKSCDILTRKYLQVDRVSTCGLGAGHHLAKRQKVALRKKLKCGTQIFFRNVFFKIIFFRFFLLLVFSIVRCRLIGVSTYGLVAGHTITMRQKVAKIEMWHLDFFFNFFFKFFFFDFFLVLKIEVKVFILDSTRISYWSHSLRNLHQ